MIAALVEVSALAVIGWFAICGLNHMGRKTRPAMVAAVVTLFAGTLARLWLLVGAPDKSDPSVAAILFAVAVGMLANRRRSINCPCLPSFSAPAGRNDKEIHA